MSRSSRKRKFNLSVAKNADKIEANSSSRSSTAITNDNNSSLYFVPARIQEKRLKILKECAIKNGYSVLDSVREGVSHILTEFETEDQVWRNFGDGNQDQINLAGKVQIVSIKWFTDSVKQGKPISPIPPEYKLKVEKKTSIANTLPKIDYSMYNCYACQRKTPLKHKNSRLTDGLEVVARHAELRDNEGDYVRALAFHKAMAVLKSLPFVVTKVEQASRLKDVGKHSISIIQGILEDGFSDEAEQIKNDEWFQTIKLFNTIFGVGPVLAKQWYSFGLRTICDVIQSKLNEELPASGDIDKINHGLAFHEDLNTPLLLSEANDIYKFMKQEAEDILPGVKVEIAGGFRRGKPYGHDVDILFTHPTQGQEVGLLQELHQRLSNMGFILYGYVHKNSFTEDKLKQEINTTATQNSAMDDFEKCFYIFRMPKGNDNFKEVKLTGKVPPPRSDFSVLHELSNMERNWKAVRVDLILSPKDQFAFALVGWTGNKNFNRSIRNYSKKFLNMRLTSHGLWSFTTQKRIPASTEQDVFDNLKLTYIEPWERNV